MSGRDKRRRIPIRTVGVSRGGGKATLHLERRVPSVGVLGACAGPPSKGVSILRPAGRTTWMVRHGEFVLLTGGSGPAKSSRYVDGTDGCGSASMECCAELTTAWGC